MREPKYLLSIFLAAVIIAAVAWRYARSPLQPDEGFSVILSRDRTRLISDATMSSMTLPTTS